MVLKSKPREFSIEQIKNHNSEDDFWAVIDNYVVDITKFMKSHPGGLKKLLIVNDTSTGATGEPYGFSFANGKNKHYPETDQIFQNGVKEYLDTITTNGCLPSKEVAFPSLGSIIILGILNINH